MDNSKRNRLLRRVVAHLKREPRRLNMGGWLYASDYSPCGTVACIFGWIHQLATKRQRMVFVHDFFDPVRRWLGLTIDEAASLAYVSDWPDRYAEQFDRATTQKGKVNVVGRRVEHFIRTGE